MDYFIGKEIDLFKPGRVHRVLNLCVVGFNLSGLVALRKYLALRHFCNKGIDFFLLALCHRTLDFAFPVLRSTPEALQGEELFNIGFHPSLPDTLTDVFHLIQRFLNLSPDTSREVGCDRRIRIVILQPHPSVLGFLLDKCLQACFSIDIQRTQSLE